MSMRKLVSELATSELGPRRQSSLPSHRIITEDGRGHWLPAGTSITLVEGRGGMKEFLRAGSFHGAYRS